jgi:hypothetical protein
MVGGPRADQPVRRGPDRRSRKGDWRAWGRIRRGPRTRRQLRSVSGAVADIVLTPQTRASARAGASDRNAHRALPIRAHGALPQDRQIAMSVTARRPSPRPHRPPKTCTRSRPPVANGSCRGEYHTESQPGSWQATSRWPRLLAPGARPGPGRSGTAPTKRSPGRAPLVPVRAPLWVEPPIGTPHTHDTIRTRVRRRKSASLVTPASGRGGRTSQ